MNRVPVSRRDCRLREVLTNQGSIFVLVGFYICIRMNSWNTCSKKQFVQQIVSWARSGKCQIFASIKQMNEHESEDECERKIMKDSKSMDEPFPLKLHRMLGEVENTSDQGILSWGPSGHCFIIFQPKMFATRIMGEYFRQTKYKSFQRQLNLYGFVREVRGKIRGVYSHPQFIRESRDLCYQIKRVNRTRMSESATTETTNSTVNQGTNVSSIDFQPMFSNLGLTIPPIPCDNSNFAFPSIAASSPPITSSSRQTAVSNTLWSEPKLPPSEFNTFPGSQDSVEAGGQYSLEDEDSIGTIDEMPSELPGTNDTLDDGNSGSVAV